MFAAILIFATPLYTSSGYISIGAFFIIWVVGYKKVSLSTVWRVLFLCLFFVIYMIASPLVTKGNLNVAITMFGMAAVMLMVFPGTIYNGNLLVDNTGERLFSTAYIAIWAVTMEQLIVYMYNNWEGWRFRIPTGRLCFLANYHHVDFSVIVICVFLLGAKRGYYVKSLILAVVSLVALPARTLQLFFILFLCCKIFQKQIFRIIDHKIIRNSFLWILLMVLGIAVFSVIWLFSLTKIYTIAEGHTGLYDTSNYERFRTILYALKVIWDKKLIVSGVSVMANYNTMTSFPSLPNFPELASAGPHNTYVAILLNFSIMFGGIYLYWVSKIIDKVMSIEMIPYVIPYLLCGCILHDMLSGPRMLLYLAILILPFKRKKTIYNNYRKQNMSECICEAGSI